MPQPRAPAFRALTEYRVSIGDYSRFAMSLEVDRSRSLEAGLLRARPNVHGWLGSERIQ
jgi:hypothetical protein